MTDQILPSEQIQENLRLNTVETFCRNSKKSRKKID